MDELALPETRYALSGDVSIAYQVMGDAPIDLILVPGIHVFAALQQERRGWPGDLSPNDPSETDRAARP